MSQTVALLLAATALGILGGRAAGSAARSAQGPVASRLLSMLSRAAIPQAIVGVFERMPAGRTGRGLGRARAAAAGSSALGLAVLTGFVPALLPAMALAPLGAYIADGLSAATSRERRRRLVEQVPDALNLLSVSTGAGMAPDAALALVAREVGGPFEEEFAAVNRAVRLGTPRRAALEALAGRSQDEQIEQLCGVLIRADQLGTPVADSLERLAAGMRHERAQRARDRAAKAAPKIQLVVALLMVPATLLLVIGVLLIELTRQVNAVLGTG